MKYKPVDNIQAVYPYGQTPDGHDFIKTAGTLFRTTSNLSNGEEFSTDVLKIKGYQQVQTSINASHNGVFNFYFYSDETTLERTISLTYTASDGFKLYSAPCFTDYVKYTFLNNSGSNQTSMFYETKVLNSALSPQVLDLESTLSPKMSATVNRSIIVAKDSTGNYVNVAADLDGGLKISDGITGIYGESINVEYTPYVQNSHFYGISSQTQLQENIISGGGTVSSTVNGNAAVLSIGTTIYDYSVQRDRRVIKYRHGFGNIVRVGCIFDTPVADSLQFAGVGNALSDFYFCYTGTTFGIRRGYNGLLHIMKLTISAAASGVESLTITLNDTPFTFSVAAAGGDTNFTAHQIEVNGYTGWDVEHFGDVVYFIARSVGARSGTYSFVNNTGGGTAAASFTTTTTGIALDTEFVPQSSWNGPSPLVTSLDPLKANLYEIQYTWFGTANILFKVYNSDTGKFELVHSLTYANAGTEYSVSSANMYIQKGVASLGSTTALSIQSSGSFGASLGRTNILLSPRASVSNSKSISVSTETAILVVYCVRQINGFTNNSELRLLNLSVASDGNRPVVIKIVKDPTNSPTPTTTDYTSLTYFNENQSLIASDIVTDTWSGGLVLFETIVGKNGNTTLDLSDLEYFIEPGSSIVISAFSTAVNTVDVSLSILSDL